jgi:SnoaL-like domain
LNGVENVTNDARSTVQAYVDAWNEPDEAARRELLHQSWAADGSYLDPLVRIEGREALVHHARKFADRWPEARVVITSGVDQHNGYVRFTWQVVSPDGEALREGTDFGELGEDGRLRRIVGFFGPPPQRH